MKQAADKSHHTLHKFVRRYEVIKQDNVSTIFAYWNILSLCEIFSVLHTYLCNLVRKYEMWQINYTKCPYAGAQITNTYSRLEAYTCCICDQHWIFFCFVLFFYLFYTLSSCCKWNLMNYHPSLISLTTNLLVNYKYFFVFKGLSEWASLQDLDKCGESSFSFWR